MFLQNDGGKKGGQSYFPHNQIVTKFVKRGFVDDPLKFKTSLKIFFYKTIPWGWKKVRGEVNIFSPHDQLVTSLE
jgi:hypothetical protein